MSSVQNSRDLAGNGLLPTMKAVFAARTKSAEEITFVPCDEFTVAIWSPVEIRLQSTVDYENPYTATEIDAVFTHTDGTTVKLPGFWMDGRIWAVRFSPTKVGDWHYAVTCRDASNAGLTAAGMVHATEAVGDTALSRHGFVTVKAGEHVYRYADGTPFLWLGDTNWQAFSQVSTTICNYPGCACGNQFKHIVDDRLEKGFNVYQTYFVPEGGNGEPRLWKDAEHEHPAVELFNGKVDDMFAYLHERGLVITLGLGCHGSTMSVMKLDAFLRFVRYVVARYACYSIVWITGQEITDEGKSKTPGRTVFDCYLEAAALVDRLDGYKHPNSAHMFPMPVSDPRAVRLDLSAWHDTWTLQSGHGYVQSKDFYRGYYNAVGSGHVKPLIESEANYEDINCGPFSSYDLNRMGAWTAMLCGSAGFTYGVTGIWAHCFSTDRYAGWYGATNSYSYEPWYIGLDKPGSFEVAYMKEFFTAIGSWYELIPQFKDSTQATFVERDDQLLASTADAALFVAYFRNETAETGAITALDPCKSYSAYWFDPRTGAFVPIGAGIVAPDGRYDLPEKPDRRDWVFLLTAQALGAHREEAMPVDLNPDYASATPTGTRVMPVRVTAVGGISYHGEVKEAQVMTDPTERLCDGDPTTVWKPVADRTTQTILLDLGEVRELTYVTVTPAEGTVIPHFRVEGSNDGRVWSIITDTSCRAAAFPGAGREPLAGAYRYVKVLLLNAATLDVGADALATLPYKALFNPMTKNSYSVTEITGIELYAK